MDITDFEGKHLILAWGLTTALGWLATMAMAGLQMTGGQVMAVWTVLMVIPLTMTALLYRRGDSNKIFNFWAVVVAVLMVENLLTPDSIAVYSFFLLWMVAGAAGFYYTSERLPPPSDKTYWYAAILSALAIPVVYHDYRAGAILGLIIQGGPVLYDYWTVHR